jgi:hypothetical protein
MSYENKQMGELIIDHRASPGINPALRKIFGDVIVPEGTMRTFATMTCSHCKTVNMRNPDRIRPRHYCAPCNNHYICDLCAASAARPGYIHRNFEQIADMVRSEKYVLAGPLTSPILIPKGASHHG